ncbi:hypothetical protein FACS189426_10140 [Bacteroidia bacterium]|nr:hypothetical protein FACS189426_10140 [Bacteroidia bacterium]GHV70909.1 hypothetical protein FACS189420_3940 [Bacteroidia bacterium]
MKTVKSISLGLLLAAMAMFTGCGPSAEDILKKYETHSVLDAAANKAGVSLDSAILHDVLTVGNISIASDNFVVEYAHPALKEKGENVQLLSNRFVVVRADKPEEIVSVNIHDKETEKGFVTTLHLPNQADKGFFLICFKGIDKSESATLATPPCFFIVSVKDKKLTVLTQQPLLGDGLFDVDYTKTHINSFTEPQIYSGTINFEKSKDVTVQFTLTADGTQVTAYELSAEKLFLTPKKTYMTSVVFNRLRIEFTKPVEVANGKISLNAFLFSDLSVTDACIYGTVKFDTEDGNTQPVYAVFKNITTPQEIPTEILNPNK